MRDVKTIVDKLLAYCRGEDFKGYDPYDLKAYPWLIGLQKRMFTKYVAELIFSNFPLLLRKLLHIQKKENNKATAIFVRSLVMLYQKTKKSDYLKEAEELYRRLKKNQSSSHHLSWGYPFLWQTKSAQYSENFPNIAVTIQGALAALALFKVTHSAEYKDDLNRIIAFISNDLKKSYKENHLFLSYSPSDHYQVLNVNAQIAGFLALYSMEFKTKEYKELIGKIINTILYFQREDGSWGYREDESNSFVDHYHTAILIENLIYLNRYFERNDLKKAIRDGFGFYKNNLFYNHQIPLWRTNLRIPIDVHSNAHALILLHMMHDDDLDRVLDWTLAHMHYQNYFIYRYYKVPEIKSHNFKEWIYRNFVFRTKDTMSYMRWSQAWMLLALANLL